MTKKLNSRNELLPAVVGLVLVTLMAIFAFFRFHHAGAVAPYVLVLPFLWFAFVTDRHRVKMWLTAFSLFVIAGCFLFIWVVSMGFPNSGMGGPLRDTLLYGVAAFIVGCISGLFGEDPPKARKPDPPQNDSYDY